MKFVEKVRNLSTRAKVAISTAVATVGSTALAVCASAAETEGTTDIATVLGNAGDSLMSSFDTLLQTMIPVIMGILGSALVIFGIFALIKFAKKTFGKVAG